MPWHDRYGKGVVYAVATSGVAINAAYAASNLREMLDPFAVLPVRQALAAAAAFEAAWALLLLWFLFDPCRRRGVLLLSVPPILLASSGHCLLEGGGAHAIVTSLAVSVVYAALYVFAHGLLDSSDRTV